MRAWQLGVTIMIIGVLVFLYAEYFMTILDPNFFMTALLGVMIFLLGIAILGIKFRQWVERH